MKFYSLPALEKMGFGKISRLPVCIRIVLESIVRNYDDKKITATHVKQLARWKPNAARTDEIPFVVARIVYRILPAFHYWQIWQLCGVQLKDLEEIQK